MLLSLRRRMMRSHTVVLPEAVPPATLYWRLV